MVGSGVMRKSPVVPPYQLMTRIGEGGMATVYRSTHPLTGQSVAIKVLKPQLAEDPSFVERFEQEFRTTRKLLHPNMVQVLEMGRTPEAIYLVMEYVDGVNLQRKVEQEGPLPEVEAVCIIAQAAQALDYAHKQWIIHRDVKPDNLLVRHDGQVKLTDFGLVKDIYGDRQLTQPFTAMGTTHYMAPEQYFDAKRVDHRSDIYSLAATLYLAVTGAPPFFDCRTIAALMTEAIAGKLTPARQLNPNLSEEADEAIRQALHPDPTRRPNSCLEFVTSLKRRRPAAEHDQPENHAALLLRSQDGARGGECRASLRHPYGVGTSCDVGLSLHQGGAEGGDSWPAVVQDISRGGVALILGRRLEVGTIVAVELCPADVRAARSLQVRIANVRPFGFGHWRMGGEFIEPLSSEDLQTLLEGPSTSPPGQ